MSNKIFYDFQRFCATHGLILDTNMLILYIIGETNENEITKNDLTNRYSPELYYLIKNLVIKSKYGSPIITPHTVSEVSHHLKLDSNHKKKNRNIKFSPWLDKSLNVFRDSREEHIKTKDIIESRSDIINELAHYGIPDLSIVDLSEQEDYAVLTDDTELYDHIYKKGQKVMSAAILNTFIVKQNI